MSDVIFRFSSANSYSRMKEGGAFVKYLKFLSFMLLLSSCHSNISEQLNVTQSQFQIIGGTPAQLNEFPFMVNIWFNSPEENYKDHFCGGSLIHSRFVLTAAHCVMDDNTEQTKSIIHPEKLMLFMGSNRITGEGGFLLKAKSILVHPLFSWPHYDMALIELEAPVLNIQPVLLNTQEIYSSVAALVIGWGVTDKDGKISAPFLQKALLPLVSRSECGKDALILRKGWTITQDMLCADTQQNQKASCHGDSGGPVLVSQNGRYLQVGIVSWGSACNPNPRTTPSTVEGHANVAEAYPWIMETVKKAGSFLL
ncbi:MAG: S1 family peptidase [Pseudobdellovibrionaceae bacterium]